MAEVAPQVHYPFWYTYIWPNFFPNNYDRMPSIRSPDAIDPYFHSATNTSPLAETTVIVILLIIAQLLIPNAASYTVRLWPRVRESSVRVVYMLGWYAVMASMVIGTKKEIKEAWKNGFERGWLDAGGEEGVSRN